MLDDCVASGIRQFYFPPPLQQGGTPYDWSFMRPVVTLEIPLNAQAVQLPDDFGGFEGVITVKTPNTTRPFEVRLFNEGAVRQAYSNIPTASGPPTMAALSFLKGTTQQQGQRQQLAIYPAADQDYTVQFQYYLLPDYLTGNNPYVYGGAAHVETILESCLAIAEQRIDDLGGLHSGKFMERLAASIGMDRKNKAEVTGYNGDRSDGPLGNWNRHQSFPANTYNGLPFG